MKIGIMNHPAAYDFDIGQVKKALVDYKLGIIGHTSPFLPFTFPLRSIRETALKEFKKYIDIFSRLDVELMNIHPFHNVPKMYVEVFSPDRNYLLLSRTKVIKWLE